MRHSDGRGSMASGAPADPIGELVRGQQRLVRSWGRFAVGSIDRLQSGNLEVNAWLAAYREFADETVVEIARTLRAISER